MTKTTSLYIHFPWCIKKCPYCDFNSHQLQASSDFAIYTKKLITDLDSLREKYDLRKFHSVFFGGGTPSLCPPQEIQTMIDHLLKNQLITANTEITLEANPGTIDRAVYMASDQQGVNRLSLGVQSFNDQMLDKIGEIHDAKSAIENFHYARELNFQSINIDLMYGLVSQSPNMAISDVKTALNLDPDHLSFYELTIEPNTLFHYKRPTLPNDQALEQIEMSCKELIQNTYDQYEISAFSKPNHQCAHNNHYWRYGDYLGIGAGAHSKLSISDKEIIRLQACKHPKTYLANNLADNYEAHTVNIENQVFEFALNRWRLTSPIQENELEILTPEGKALFQKLSNLAIESTLIINENQEYKKTKIGEKFHNELVSTYLLDN